MAELDPRTALEQAKAMKSYVESYNGQKWSPVFDSPDRQNLAQALDHLMETAAMLMNMADRCAALAALAARESQPAGEGLAWPGTAVATSWCKDFPALAADLINHLQHKLAALAAAPKAAAAPEGERCNLCHYQHGHCIGCPNNPIAGVVVIAYAIDIGPIDSIRIERARQMEGPALWAVRKSGYCLNKSGEWEWEPMPSGRDDEFLARCRFDTPREAIDAALSAGGRGGKSTG